ncbi:MAG: glycerophosphodiester phosphodiesterase [Clostridiales bacterium]|nr:glycerophosphodiester phosphodiesterase [Clostridiales bacterium]
MDLFKSWLVETPIAHRGYHNKNIPENSIAAFEKAIEKGYAIELDVQLLADNTVVVFHDESLARMTGNDGYLKYLNKPDLKALKLKDSKETIPTLEQVLKVVDGRVPLLIEIKNKYKVGQLEQALINILRKYKGEFAVQSFNPFSLGYFRENAPEILRGQLAGTFKTEKMSWIRKYMLRTMKLNKKVSQPHFISYEASALPNRTVRKYKSLPLLAWTIRSKEEYIKVVKHCDNIIFEKFDPEI